MVERRQTEELEGQAWLVRDLPPDVDLDDSEGLYGTKFHELWTTDDSYPIPAVQ